jgi:hypothetical protein
MALKQRVAEDLARDMPGDVLAMALLLAEHADAAAVLFYGSVLRTGKFDDLLDFYVLTDEPAQQPLVWPQISMHAISVGARVLRAKVATMPLALFADAASGRRLDTTIWTRFCQPCALAWVRDAEGAGDVAEAVAAAIVTAASYAAVLGPAAAPAEAFWAALFERTYTTELRVETPGRSGAIVAHAPRHYAELLPLAWAEAGIGFAWEGEALRPVVPAEVRQLLSVGWRRRAALGKPLNILRLVKAALTMRGAGSYALWKIERHTGGRIAATNWRRAQPVLAAPGVLWQLWRLRERQTQPGADQHMIS